MAKKLKPMHPGEVLREEFLVPLKMSARACAPLMDDNRGRVKCKWFDSDAFYPLVVMRGLEPRIHCAGCTMDRQVADVYVGSRR